MNSTTVESGANLGGYTPLPLEFSYVLGICASISVLCSFFIVVSFPLRHISLMQSPFSLVFAQGLFELIFGVVFLANYFLTAPGLASNSSLSPDVNALQLCQSFPILGALLVAALCGSETCFVLLAFDVHSFSASPFGRGVQCCRLGLYYIFQPTCYVIIAVGAFATYYGGVVSSPTTSIGTFPFGACAVSYDAPIGAPVRSDGGTALLLTALAIFDVAIIIAFASVGPSLYTLSHTNHANSALMANAKLFSEMMQPRKMLVRGYGGCIATQMTVRLLTMGCVGVLAGWEFRATSFTMWGQTTVVGVAPSDIRTAFVAIALLLWSLRGTVQLLSLYPTSFVTYTCCLWKLCLPKAVVLVKKTDEARHALFPVAPHNNEALADTIGAILGEGIAFLAAQSPSVGVIGLRARIARPDAPAKASKDGPTLLGKSVLVNRGSKDYERGVVRFHGPTSFAAGTWVGIDLNSATGRNDGTIQGHQYFSCKPLHGIFVNEESIVELEGEPFDVAAFRAQVARYSSNGDTDQKQDNAPGFLRQLPHRTRPASAAAAARAKAQKNGSGDRPPCCEASPMDPILLDEDTMLPIEEWVETGKKPSPPQITLRAVHEDILRPMRQFLLGSVYCPEFGLTGSPNDPGLDSYLTDSRHLRGVNMFFNQVRFCRPMSRWHHNLRERRWQMYPAQLQSVFRFSSLDDRILIDAMGDDEFRALTKMIRYNKHGGKGGGREPYDEYVRSNPETLLPRILGCYELVHTGLRFKQYFIVHMNPHPPSTAIKAMFSLDGRIIGRNTPPLKFGQAAVCQHCGKHYFCGFEKVNLSDVPHSPRQRRGADSSRESPVNKTSDTEWWQQCHHRPATIVLDNDFELSMLTEQDDALTLSAQLVADVGYLEAFEHTYYSLTMSFGKSASVSLEQYLDAEARRARIRRGTCTEADIELETQMQLKRENSKGSMLFNTAFEATVNGVATPVHVGLDDVFCQWNVNMQVYDQSLHKREKAIAFCGCFSQLRQRILRQKNRDEVPRHGNLAEATVLSQEELVEELRTGLSPEAHADRFVNRIVARLFRHVQAKSSGAGGKDGVVDFNADEHLANNCRPMSWAEKQREKRMAEEAERERQARAAAEVEVELSSYGGSPASENFQLPTSPRRTPSGHYRYGDVVTV